MLVFNRIGAFRGHQQIAHADGGAPAPQSRPNAVDWMNGVGNVFSSIGSMFTGWGAARGNQTDGQGNPIVIPGAPNNSNTTFWIGLMVVVLVICGVLFWVVKRKK